MKRLLLIALLLITATFTAAQGAPEQINVALAALNERLGTSYTLNDINWFWSQDNFDDTSLGCPQEGETYTPGPIVGYIFEFTVGEEVYEYRVSADTEVVILCSVTTLGEEPADAPSLTVDDVDYTNPLCQEPPEGIRYMPTRLTVGIQARVEPGLPNRLRAQPDTAAEQIGEIPAEGVFGVIQGPSCDDEGYLWWQVNYNGTTGWTAEGIDGDYFVEPVPGTELPATMPITNDNVTLLAELSSMSGNLGDALAWSQSTEIDDPGTLTVTGALGSAGAWVYDVSALDAPPRVLFNENRFTTADFGRTLDLALLGGVNGGLHLWDLSEGAPLVERAFLQGHNSAVTASLFSNDGARLVSSGGLAFLREDQEDNLYAISVWDVENVSLIGGLRGHTDTVTDLALSADNVTLFSGSLDGFVRVWDIALMQRTNSIEVIQPVTAIAKHPTTSIIAVGTENGTVLLYETANNTLLATLTAHAGTVNDLSFNADGTLLASAGADSTVQLWDTREPSDGITPDTLTGHQGVVFAVAFSPDGTLLATLGEDDTVRVWGVPATNFG